MKKQIEKEIKKAEAHFEKARLEGAEIEKQISELNKKRMTIIAELAKHQAQHEILTSLIENKDEK